MHPFNFNSCTEMKIEFFLKCLLDHLNHIHSLVTIEYFDVDNGLILLSTGKVIAIADLKTPADIEKFL